MEEQENQEFSILNNEIEKTETIDSSVLINKCIDDLYKSFQLDSLKLEFNSKLKN